MQYKLRIQGHNTRDGSPTLIVDSATLNSVLGKAGLTGASGVIEPKDFPDTIKRIKACQDGYFGTAEQFALTMMRCLVGIAMLNGSYIAYCSAR